MITSASNDAIAVVPDMDGWWTLTLDDALPMFGEGRSWDEAQGDLVSGVAALWRSLKDRPNDKLAPHLVRERALLEAIRAALV